MKKAIGLIALLILIMGLVGCNGETVNIDFPFEVGDVENIEMYHYAGVPVSAEKKVVVAESDITGLYDMFEDLSLKDKQVEETTGADVTSFRFNLSDGSSSPKHAATPPENITISGGVLSARRWLVCM